MAQKTRRRADHASTPAREHHLREAVARSLGVTLSDIHEWNTRVCPDCYKDVELYPTCRATSQGHLPPLYYALVNIDLADDMPLGIGPTAVAALTDLHWQIHASALLADLRDA
jgi:hypothetical protein